MNNLKRIKEYIKNCESVLHSLDNSKNNKSILIKHYNNLNKIKNYNFDSEKNQELESLLKEVNDLMFIVTSMIDYYSEEMGER